MVVEDTPIFDWKFALGIAAAFDGFIALMWWILGPSLQTHSIPFTMQHGAWIMGYLAWVVLWVFLGGFGLTY